MREWLLFLLDFCGLAGACMIVGWLAVALLERWRHGDWT
jgi:hypothetical protein